MNEYAEKTQAYTAAADALDDAVGSFRFDTALRESTAARTACEDARVALEAHCKEHGC